MMSTSIGGTPKLPAKNKRGQSHQRVIEKEMVLPQQASKIASTIQQQRSQMTQQQEPQQIKQGGTAGILKNRMTNNRGNS